MPTARPPRPAAYLDEPPPEDDFEPPADRDQATLKQRPVRPAEPVRSADSGRPAGPRPGPGSGSLPDAAQASPVTAADVRRLWPEVLSAVMKRRRVTWMRLKEHAQVVEVRDRALVLAFSNDGIREQFARGGHEDILRDALVDVMGADLRILAVAGEPAPTRRDVPRAEASARPVPGRGPTPSESAAPAPDPWPAPASSGSGGPGPTGQDVDSASAAGSGPTAGAQSAVPGPAAAPEPAASSPGSAPVGQVAHDPASTSSGVGGPDPWAEPTGPTSTGSLPGRPWSAPEPDGQSPEPTSHAALLERARQERAAANPETSGDEGLGEIDPDDPEVDEHTAEELLRTMLGAEVVDDDQ